MTTSPGAQPLRVFIVENHPATVRYLQLHLESLGYIVRRSESVASALETLREGCCDVLISDIGLPDGSGWTLLKKLRENGVKISLAVAVSGYGTAADRARSAEAGFSHHLVKPFDPSELDDILRHFAETVMLKPEG